MILRNSVINMILFFNILGYQSCYRYYRIILDYLSEKDYHQPKVPDLGDIVPLPPAPLPEWDGKIIFQHWFEGEAPPKPDEALMRRLAWQAGLNGDMGLDEKTDMPKKPTK
jgi:Sel1 repeat protein